MKDRAAGGSHSEHRNQGSAHQERRKLWYKCFWKSNTGNRRSGIDFRVPGRTMGVN